MTTDPTGRHQPVRGEFAAFRGVLYPARAAAGRWPCVELLPAPGTPAPEGVAPRLAADGSVAGYPLPPELLDAWYTAHWTFRWRGEPFECTDRVGDTVSGSYLGSDREFAAQHLKRRITGHRGTFPLAEVTEPEEHREDLLGPRLELARRLAEADHFRPGGRAVLAGTTHRAATSTDARGLVVLDGVGAVSPEQLDAWYRTHWTFRWQDGPFDAVGTVEGRIKGVYTGGSWGFADGHQLDEETAPDGTHTRYTVEADLDSVTDLTPHRTDLLPPRH
ncbi:hypothetical protein OU787_05955 [Kitasatospora sp. YST-16]|uniref:hypothetical protein n=1 Tax=Kitasatospora sp. YST-16 TaxID=2998080 RepID=UPI00228444B8|nr:hypothetical protein [Kitasatospora sp. YST-16]WAL71075.1 hypothetical protein OU787_05955 [Kitasatospora sp. YST-16]WNW37112.1 hypothetical protein RKE32_05910 [Streptomyces sp. Li-HN-5-13]